MTTQPAPILAAPTPTPRVGRAGEKSRTVAILVVAAMVAGSLGGLVAGYVAWHPADAAGLDDAAALAASDALVASLAMREGLAPGTILRINTTNAYGGLQSTSVAWGDGWSSSAVQSMSAATSSPSSLLGPGMTPAAPPQGLPQSVGWGGVATTRVLCVGDSKYTAYTVPPSAVQWQERRPSFVPGACVTAYQDSLAFFPPAMRDMARPWAITQGDGATVHYNLGPGTDARIGFDVHVDASGRPTHLLVNGTAQFPFAEATIHYTGDRAVPALGDVERMAFVMPGARWNNDDNGIWRDLQAPETVASLADLELRISRWDSKSQSLRTEATFDLATGAYEGPEELRLDFRDVDNSGTVTEGDRLYVPYAVEPAPTNCSGPSGCFSWRAYQIVLWDEWAQATSSV